MFQRFFVPLDGSTRAEKAIPFAARLAHEVSGTVTLARVIVPPRSTGEYGTDILATKTHLVQAQAKAYLDEVFERYDQELDGIHLVLTTAPGTLPFTLLELSSQEHSNLIVMCSKGDHWLKRWVFGSVAQQTFRQSHLPILVLNEQGDTFTLEDRPLRILVPLDGSELSEAVLEPVFQLLSTVSASAPHEVHLLRVVTTTPPAMRHVRSEAHLTDDRQKEECQEAEHALQDLAQRLPLSNPVASHCVITTSVVSSPDVAGAILKQAEPTMYGDAGQKARNYDLIALATHGRTGFKRAMLGSVTEHIFGATLLPLLVVCPSVAPSEEKHLAREKEIETPPRWVGLL
jgi:nucleotide-binding universal stress UspA family protein